MLFILFTFGFSFDLRKAFITAWNVEVVDPSFDGGEKTTYFYNFNLTRTKEEEEEEREGDHYEANVYNGDFIVGENATETGKGENSKEVVTSFNLQMLKDQVGIIEVDGVEVTKFTFEESFPYFLAAYGQCVFGGESYFYSVNVINLATIHVSLYSFEKTIFREIILTRFQVKEGQPWTEKYQGIIIGVIVFVVTFVLLHVSAPLLKFLGLSKDTEKQEEAKPNVDNKPKEAEKTNKGKKDKKGKKKAE